MLAHLATFCYRKRWIVLLLWVLALVSISMATSRLGDGFSQAFTLEGSDSQQAFDMLKAAAPDNAGMFEGDIVFKADAGVNDPEVKQQITALAERVRGLEGVVSVNSPYDPTAALLGLVAPDGKIAYIAINFDENLHAPPGEMVTATKEAIAQTARPGLQIELGGPAFQGTGDLGNAEIYGLLAAVVILLLAFGSVLAMGLPILMALFGIGVGIGLVSLLSHLVTIPDFATQLGSMIGLGVGIDYALFIVTRYRQGLRDGHEPEHAVVAAIDTAGRAVVFAGITVVISMAGMLLIGISFIGGLGMGAAVVVLIAVLAAVTLLPAILGFVGRKIDFLAIPGIGHGGDGSREGFWFRWSRFLQRHPWPFAVAGLLVLLFLAIPVLSMRLGSSDDSSLPTSSTIRRAYDLRAEGFGPGASAPLVLVTKVPEGTTPQQLLAVSQAVAETPSVASSTPLFPLPGTDVAVARVTPAFPGQDQETQDLLTELRTQTLPEATAGTGMQVHVGGITAVFDDMATKLQARLPVFIGVVLGLSFLLLMLVFRSVLVPLKAVIMNLLSIGAAYGIVVAVFQWGWAKDAIGIGNTGPVESFLPMMMFAILFGLSMDYEVFLLSRIKEEYDRSGDNALAVADGLSHTARVITAAALIMITVFGSFVLVDDRIVKMFGLGLAAAILIDASVVRMILVPATMELLGSANWWFPKWLEWLPTIHVEGHHDGEPLTIGDPDEPNVPAGRARTADATIDLDEVDLAQLIEPDRAPDPTN